jgi:hypothetical protein
MDKHESAGLPAHATAGDTRVAGFLMLVSAFVSIAFVALDPAVTATTSRGILEAMVANGTMHRVVHAVELACVLGLAFGFTSLASTIDTRRSAVQGAWVAYLIGCIAMVGAAVTDGFITGDVAGYYLKAGHSADTGREMIHFCYVVIQNLAVVAWFFQSVGVMAMAFALLRERGLQRIVGMLGLATGALPPAAIVATWPTMDSSVVIGILVAQLAWNVAASTLLMRRAPSRGQPVAMRQEPLPA